MKQQEVVADIEERASRLGVSIKDLCERAGVHPTSFSRWKKSRANPEPVGANLQKIEALYGVIEAMEAAVANAGMIMAPTPSP
jgi:transcriptional regulator with XRE-family HTH domain